MKKKKNNDYESACALCEYMTYFEMTGDYICKYKKSLITVDPDFSCPHFALDLLAIDPRPRRAFHVEVESI